jgi:uncharacterized membrane protein YadS
MMIALASTFLAEHYGGPQLLYALLIGLRFHFMMKNQQIKPGVDLCGRTVLRLGVAPLAARITLSQVAQLGVSSAILIICAVVLTVAFGLLLASSQVFPKAWVDTSSSASRWCLVAAIAAAGVKTSFEELLALSWQPVLLLVAETVFIAAFVAAGMLVLA